MKIISFLFIHSKKSVALAVLFGALSGIANSLLLAFISAAVGNKNIPKSAAVVVGFIALCVLTPLTRIASEALLIRIGQKAIFDLRMKLSRLILSVPLRQLERIGAPRLLAALTEDVLAVTNVISFIPAVCINLTVVMSCLVYLGWLSWPLLLGFVSFIVVGVIGFHLAAAKGAKHLRQAREQQDSLFRHFRSLTDGAKELKLHSQRTEAFLSDVLQPTAASYQGEVVTGMTIYSAASTWGLTLIFASLGFVLYALPTLMSISTQVLSGYTIVILYMLIPLQIIMNALPNVARANIALAKIESLGLSLSRSGQEKLAVEPGRANQLGSLELAGVTHNYRRENDGRNFTLGPIDMVFRAGEITFLVGGNGSGKTTLAKLITGLYTPEAGEIRLGGVAVTDETRERYRQNFSAVFSDFHLFEHFLGLDSENLEAKAREYLARLYLDQTMIEGNKLSTLDLSQGQRKRLALLTAYLEDRPIYVFDEWAADQDPRFKEVFYYQLLPELKARGKTVIVISHDDHYYHIADSLIKLDYGQLDMDTSLGYMGDTPAEIVNTV